MTAIDYAVILALLVAGIIGATTLLGSRVSGLYDYVTSALSLNLGNTEPDPGFVIPADPDYTLSMSSGGNILTATDGRTTVRSSWLQMPYRQEPYTFTLEGQGNPVAQISANPIVRASSGQITSGTNITMDTPAPGETFTAVIRFDDGSVGVYSITREAN